MTRRHTKRDLTRILRERDLRANRLLGQSFLVDHNVLEGIVAAGDVQPGDVVLEIGVGTGMLTGHLAQTGARVVGVEIDRGLFEIAAEYLAGFDDVRLLHRDVHGNRRELHPDVSAALDAEMAGGGTLKVVSNLPYCISSDLIVSLLDLPWPVERMILTVQKEFADRLLARPKSRHYSALSVTLRANALVDRLRNLPPNVFWPVPQVGSTVIRIVPSPDRRARIEDVRWFRSVVNALFAQRRKTAAKALLAMPRRKLTRERVDAALAAAEVGKNARADALTVRKIVAIANALATS
jgi:16S rRNA (adenine1518-N6/adenine1519-N6)-dimethyltransferase